MVLAAVVVIAMGGGEVVTGSMEIGYAIQDNDVRLAVAYGIGAGE